MTTMIDLFVEEAKLVTISDCLPLLNLSTPKGGKAEYVGPCPISGGKDRFSYNTQKNVWNCRGCGMGGHGALSLAGHVLGLNLETRDNFLAACSAILGRPIPDGKAPETEAQKRDREERLAKRIEKAKQAEAEKQKRAEYYRKKEQQKAANKWHNAVLLEKTRFNLYIERRCGGALSVWPLRLIENEPYFHGDEKIFSCAAMVAPFVAANGKIIGCHLTWLDLENPPKYRPYLINAKTAEKLPTKKMRGSKKGGLIPLRGFTYKHGQFLAASNRTRMVVGEGIETVLAMRLAEEERNDTIYAAAGDLGNLTGPADPKSRFAHPTLENIDKNGNKRPCFVAGPIPLKTNEGQSIWVPDHVTNLILIADSDSEPVMTASAMARAKSRFAKDGRKITVLWPPLGMDVADMMTMLTKPETTYEVDKVAQDGQ